MDQETRSRICQIRSEIPAYSGLSLEAADISAFRVTELIQGVSDENRGVFERELCELERAERQKANLPVPEGYLPIPPDVFRGVRSGNRAVIVAGTDTQGGHLVSQQNAPEAFATYLYAKSVIIPRSMHLMDLKDNISISTISGKPTVVWGNEAAEGYTDSLTNTAFSNVTTKTALDALSDAAFAIITVASKKYLAFKNLSAADQTKMRRVRVGDRITATASDNSRTYTAQVIYDPINTYIQVQDSAANTDLTNSTEYSISLTGTAVSDPTLSSVLLNPHEVKCTTILSKYLAMQSDPSAENVVRELMMGAFAEEFDNQIFYGSGANDRISGLVELSRIKTAPNPAKFTYDALGYLYRDQFTPACRVIGKANAADMLTWLVGWDFYALACDTYGLVENGKMLGIDIEPSSSVAPYDAWLGNWELTWCAMWGAMDIFVDPYSLKANSQIRIVGNHRVDAGFPHDDAYAQVTPNAN